MTLLLKSQLRFLRRAPWSTVTAVLGVALGVASVIAVHLISVQVDRSLSAATPPHLAGVTHLLDRPELTADDYFELRAAWRAEGWPELTGLVPLLEGDVQIDGARVRIFGMDWLAGGAPDESPAGAADTDVAVVADLLTGRALLADRVLGYAAGERLRVGDAEFRVAEVVDSGLGPAVFADIGLTQHLLSTDPSGEALSYVGAQVADPWRVWRTRVDRLMPGFGAGLPAGELPAQLAGPLDGWRVRSAQQELPSASLARSVLFNLGALGSLALVVAWFLIYQVAVIWLRRQRAVLRYLEVLGATPAELRARFLLTFVGIGLVATALGTAAGLGLARLLVRWSVPDFELPGGLAPLDAWVLAKAALSGLGVCVAGGYLAFSAQRAQAQPALWRRGALLAVLLALVGWGIAWEPSALVGGFVAILAMSLVGVVAVTPLLGLLRRASTAARGSLISRIGLREAVWYPGVLSVALSALGLAVATSLAMSLMVESFRLDFSRMLASRLAGELYLQGDPATLPHVAGWLAEQAPDARAVLSGRARVRVQGVPAELGYSRFDAAQAQRYGYARALTPGQTLLSEALARTLDVGVGDRVRLGAHAFTVVAVFPGFGDLVPRLLVDVAELGALGLAPAFDRLTVHTSAARALGTRLAERFPELAIEHREALRRQSLAIFDRTFAITHALTLLALTVAVVGVYNALTALRLAQSPTTLLLHAQGLLPRELRRLALIRASVVGGVAVALALPLGLAMAWVLCEVINPRAFGWTIRLQLPVSAWLPPLALGLLAALLAGLLPAPRERADASAGAGEAL